MSALPWGDLATVLRTWYPEGLARDVAANAASIALELEPDEVWDAAERLTDPGSVARHCARNGITAPELLPGQRQTVAEAVEAALLRWKENHHG